MTMETMKPEKEVEQKTRDERISITTWCFVWCYEVSGVVLCGVLCDVMWCFV